MDKTHVALILLALLAGAEHAIEAPPLTWRGWTALAIATATTIVAVFVTSPKDAREKKTRLARLAITDPPTVIVETEKPS
jgi:hypothetical protein